MCHFVSLLIFIIRILKRRVERRYSVSYDIEDEAIGESGLIWGTINAFSLPDNEDADGKVKLLV